MQEVIESPKLGRDSLTQESDKQRMLPSEGVFTKKNATDEPKVRGLEESRRTSNISTNVKDFEEVSSEQYKEKDQGQSLQAVYNVCAPLEKESADPIKNFSSIYNRLTKKISHPAVPQRNDNPTKSNIKLNLEKETEEFEEISVRNTGKTTNDEIKIPRIPLRNQDSPKNQQNSSEIREVHSRGRNKAVPYEPLADFKIDLFNRRGSSGPKPKDEGAERAEQSKTKALELLKAQRTNFSSTDKEPQDATPLSNRSKASRDSSAEPLNRSIDHLKYLQGN